MPIVAATRNPSAISTRPVGPTARTPTRSTSRGTRGASTIMISAVGASAAPACSGV